MRARDCDPVVVDVWAVVMATCVAEHFRSLLVQPGYMLCLLRAVWLWLMG